MFSLPSPKTLTKLLSNIPFDCGINLHIFAHLKNVVSTLKSEDKYCMLMFDEISLNTGLSYNISRDCVEGLVDLGEGQRKVIFADHALVFMLKGVHKSWKQPICFYFCEHSTATADLIRIIKEVVRHVRQTGLQVIATICDQGTTNIATIKYLLNETNAFCVKNSMENRYQGYLIDNQEVIHLYDCPHLLKGLRNGLLTKNLHFLLNTNWKVACWSHVVDLYEMDKKMGNFSQFSKLTDEHVLPQKIKKMKVKNCTQVFSRTVATAMKIRAEISTELDPTSAFYLSPLASQTADLLLFLDELFDSVNGNLLHPPLGKELRGVVTTKSNHTQVWRNAITVLNSMFFTSPSSINPIITPSIKNWIFTLRGFLYIWNLLKNKGFKFISPRSFNQDPVENFFSLIRSHGVRNTNPTCTSFISSTKSLIINNLLSSHSPGSNCEEDVSSGVLDTLKNFIRIGTDTPNKDNLSNITLPVYSHDHLKTPQPIIGKNDLATPYVAGVVIKKVFKKIDCVNCMKLMTTEEELPEHLLIKRKEYKNKSLCTPSEYFLQMFYEMSGKIYEVLPTHLNKNHLKKIKIDQLQTEAFLPLLCENHKSCMEICINIIFNICIFHYIKIINNLLNGKDLRYKDFDVLTNLAFKKFQKKRKIK